MSFFARLLISPDRRHALGEFIVAKETFLKLYSIVRLVKKFWWRQGLLSAFALVFVFLALINPYLTQLTVDGPLMNRSVEGFLKFGFLMGCISLFTMILQNYLTFAQSKLAIEAREYMTSEVYVRLTGMSLDYFRGADRNANTSVTSEGAEVATRGLSLLPEIVTTAISVTVKLVMVFWIDWRLGLIALLSPPLAAVQALFLARRNREVACVEREATLAYSKELSDSLGNIDLVKTFRTENYHIARFKRALNRLSLLWQDNQRFALYFGWASGILKKLIDGLPVFFASFLVARGSLSLGEMTAGIIYVSQFTAAHTKLIDFVPQLGSMAVSANVFMDFLKTNPSIVEAHDAKDVQFSKGEIQIENLSFAYLPKTPVLQNLSLVIQGGRWTGIKAPSGFGKTTLLNLIMRVYDPHAGRILIDGHDIRKITFKSLRSQINIVLQQAFLTRDPIWKCIAYDKEDATREEIMEAAKIAGIHHQIVSFPEGYETSCGDVGARLSQGQRQRIAIARSVLRKPKLLIMDEAFGSVDRETEDLIVQEMRSSFPSMTVVVVSHHQSILDKMDEVIDLTKIGCPREEIFSQ
jgi:ABC-type multidrug transport system fused ATPase/permease subunit